MVYTRNRVSEVLVFKAMDEALLLLISSESSDTCGVAPRDYGPAYPYRMHEWQLDDWCDRRCREMTRLVILLRL